MIGYKAGFAGGTGFNYNTVVGTEAFDAATTCQFNVVAGYQAGSTVTSNVSYCTIIGNSAAGFASGSAVGATAIGASSMSQSVISNSTGVGHNTFRTSTNAFTTAVGASAAYSGGG